MESDEYLECLVRGKTLTIYHPTSTCRMGNDPGSSVVDAKLRFVYLLQVRISAD